MEITKNSQGRFVITDLPDNQGKGIVGYDNCLFKIISCILVKLGIAFAVTTDSNKKFLLDLKSARKKLTVIDPIKYQEKDLKTKNGEWIRRALNDVIMQEQEKFRQSLMHDDLDQCRRYVDAGMNPHDISRWNKSPLNQAIFQKGFNVSKYFVEEKRVDVNQKDKGNQLPLEVALTSTRNKSLIQLLVDNGANLTLQASTGKSLKKLAIENIHPNGWSQEDVESWFGKN